MKLNLLFIIILFLLLNNCSKDQEYTESEANSKKNTSKDLILSKTIKKQGGKKFDIGKSGGTWYSDLNNDPKTFNTLIARDSDSRSVIDPLYDSLVDYDPYKRIFLPNLASFKVETDEKNDKMKIIYTLREDLYWTIPETMEKIKVTSDDVIFWYNEIDGDKNLQLPGYPGQFVEMADGSKKRIEIQKIDINTFAFLYPRIVNEPLLSTNTEFGPKFIFEKAKKEGGIEKLLKLFSIDTPVKKIPVLGKYYIDEYIPGVKVVLKKNPNYWKKDDKGQSLPYIETIIYKIVPDKNTEFLLFKEGKIDSYLVRAEDLDELLKFDKPDFSIYNGGASLGSAFITFNQNQKSMDKTVNSWFVQTKFRQAMSCMINRKRIVDQVYRGLAEPAIYFFAKPNPFFDEKIKQKYIFDPKKAVKLLEEIGIKKNKDGFMTDKNGNKIEFEINVGVENNIGSDIANIFSDELKGIGINLKVKPIDFQKLVDMIMNTYDWQCCSVALGSNYWPSQGSNVWPSKGNFHIWNPLQSSPATDWEKRIDHLYNEGQFTIDKKNAKKIYDEFQQTILDQCPLIYLVYPNSFFAIRNKWQNVYYDTLKGLDTDYIYLKD
jgi:peptide/nickel transport system substrate-binding protein